jgi:hypothetical protein
MINIKTQQKKTNNENKKTNNSTKIEKKLF